MCSDIQGAGDGNLRLSSRNCLLSGNRTGQLSYKSTLAPGVLCSFLECTDPLGQPVHVCLRFCSNRTKCVCIQGWWSPGTLPLPSRGNKVPHRNELSLCRQTVWVSLTYHTLTRVLSRRVCTCGPSSTVMGDRKRHC